MNQTDQTNQMIFSLCLPFFENDEIMEQLYPINSEFKQMAQNYLRHELFVQYFSDCSIMVQKLNVSFKFSQMLLKDCKRHWKTLINSKSDRDVCWFVQLVHIQSFCELTQPISKLLNRLFDQGLLKTENIFFELFSLTNSFGDHLTLTISNDELFTKIIVDYDNFQLLRLKNLAHLIQQFELSDENFSNLLFLMSDQEIQQHFQWYNEICSMGVSFHEAHKLLCVNSIWEFVIKHGSKSVKIISDLFQKFPNLPRVDRFFNTRNIVEFFENQDMEFNIDKILDVVLFSHQVYVICDYEKLTKIQHMSSKIATKLQIVYDEIVNVHYDCLLLTNEKIKVYFDHLMKLFDSFPVLKTHQTKFLVQVLSRLDNHEIVKRCNIIKQLKHDNIDHIIKLLTFFPHEIAGRMAFVWLNHRSCKFPSEVTIINQLSKKIQMVEQNKPVIQTESKIEICSEFLPFWSVLKDYESLSLIEALEIIANKDKKCSRINKIWSLFSGSILYVYQLKILIFIQTQTTFDNDEFVRRWNLSSGGYEWSILHNLGALAQKFEINQHVNNCHYVETELVPLLKQFSIPEKSTLSYLTPCYIDHLELLKSAIIEINQACSVEYDHPLTYLIEKVLKMDHSTLVDYWSIIRKMTSFGILMWKCHAFLSKKSILRYYLSIIDQERIKDWSRLVDCDSVQQIREFQCEISKRILIGFPELLINDSFF